MRAFFSVSLTLFPIFHSGIYVRIRITLPVPISLMLGKRRIISFSLIISIIWDFRLSDVISIGYDRFRLLLSLPLLFPTLYKQHSVNKPNTKSLASFFISKTCYNVKNIAYLCCWMAQRLSTLAKYKTYTLYVQHNLFFTYFFTHK